MDKPLVELPELARELGTSVEALINLAAHGKFPLCVIADHWTGRRAEGDTESDVTVDGLVELDPGDLLKSLNAEATEVRQVNPADGGMVRLHEARLVRRGTHYVTAEERDRVLKKLTPEPAKDESKTGAPYLDPSHPDYSYTLEAAISAWMAMYVEGGFVKKSTGEKAQIEAWLETHRTKVGSDHAREAIARVVNPRKEGGNPLTKK